MRRTIEISASFTGKISTGSFENESPFFSVKEILEVPEGLNEFDDDYIKFRQGELQEMCYSQFKAQAQRAYQERIEKLYKNIRFYIGKDGVKYPSVTSIINDGEDFHMTQEQLSQYASRGTVLHKQIEIFLKTGEWKAPKDIPEIASDVMTVLKGSLGLDLEDTDFRQFYKDYPFKVIELEQTVINDEHKYGGRMDILAVIESNNPGKWKGIEGVIYDTPTILDVKSSTTLDKTKGLTQQAAYAKCNDAKQIGLIHLNKENQCGYGKPQLSSKIDSYFNIFLKQRNQFAEKYGV